MPYFLWKQTQVMLTVDGDELRIRKADNWLELRGMLADSEVNATAVLLEGRRFDRAREE